MYPFAKGLMGRIEERSSDCLCLVRTCVDLLSRTISPPDDVTGGGGISV